MRVLYIEPFEGGSHAYFGRQLRAALPEFAFTCVTLPARHWKWRMRGAAVWAAQQPELERASERYDLVFASSYLALGDLLGLRPDLADLPRVVYFHENQLAFPMRPEFSGERDLHYGFSQLVAAGSASACWFNSHHNLESFYAAAEQLLARMPDARPRGWVGQLRARSRVMPLLLDLPDSAPDIDADRRTGQRGPTILWNHRWEHDKDPTSFFEAIEALCDTGLAFHLAVCGQRFSTWPAVFDEARSRIERHEAATVEAWGQIEARADYQALLARTSVVVSSAVHEFFGISVLEAVHAGAQPLVPDALAYPELYPPADRYPDGGLAPALIERVAAWHRGDRLRADRRSLTRRFDRGEMGPRYAQAMRALVEAATA